MWDRPPAWSTEEGADPSVCASQADRLPVPSPDVLTAAEVNLTAIRPRVAAALRAGQLETAARSVDEVLLVGELGLAASEVTALQREHVSLRARRSARGADARIQE